MNAQNSLFVAYFDSPEKMIPGPNGLPQKINNCCYAIFWLIAQGMLRSPFSFFSIDTVILQV